VRRTTGTRLVSLAPEFVLAACLLLAVALLRTRVRSSRGLRPGRHALRIPLRP
jgi:hypothetical protein